MPTYTSTQGVDAMLPDDYGSLIVRPVTEESVALRTFTVQTTGSTEFHIPIVAEDPAAAWVAEGDEIADDDADFDELTVRPAKVAGLSIVSREMAADSSPAAAEVIGRGLARAIVVRVDQAAFGDLSAPAPGGLEGLAGTTTVNAPASFADLDPFAEAISEAEQEGAELTAFVANPADALELSQLKEGQDSARPLLGADATEAGDRRILGVPLYTSPAVTAGTVWGVPRDRAFAVLRDDVRVERSEHAHFSTDRIAIRATMRVGFAFPHPAAIVQIVKGE
jgi:HK97 family phage major capsid protein